MPNDARRFFGDEREELVVECVVEVVVVVVVVVVDEVVAVRRGAI